jgi:predicted outer membrane repeat protein
MTHTATTRIGLLARRALSALTATALLAGLLVGTPSAVRAGGTIYVGPGTDDSGGSCTDPDYGVASSDAATAIDDAIDDVSAPDVVILCAGTYQLDDTVHIDRAITFQGVGAASVVITPATGPIFEGTLLMVEAGPVLISDITVDGATKNWGVGDGNGAGILAWEDVALTVNDSVFTNNEAGEGAAIWMDDNSSLITHNNLFQGNVAEDGGAIYFDNGGEGSLFGDTFIDNHAEGSEDSEGGAIHMDGYDSASLLSVEDATFSGNTADEDGGAIFANEVDLVTITDSTFTDNHAIGESGTTEGGAVYFQSSGSLTVVRSRFTGNSAYEDGGAIDLDSGGEELSGHLTLLNSTFVNNHASGDAGANGGAVEGPGYTIEVSGSTFTGNIADDDGGAIYAETATITRSSFTRNTSQTHGGAVALSLPASSDLSLMRRNTFSRNTAAAGGAMTLGPCGTPSRSQAARVERANRFSGNRATEQRRTMNIERWEDCVG